MVQKVLLTLDDIVLAAGVAPMLQDLGVEADIVADQLGLSARAEHAGVAAIVVQDQYMDGASGESLLAMFAQLRGQVLPAVMVCEKALSEEQRKPLIKQWGVRAFLNHNTSDESLVKAIKLALELTENGVSTEKTTTADEQAKSPFEHIVTLSGLEDVSEFVSEDYSLDTDQEEALLLELQDEIIELNQADEIDSEENQHSEITRNAPNPLLSSGASQSNPVSLHESVEDTQDAPLQGADADEKFTDDDPRWDQTNVEARAEDFVRPHSEAAAMEVIALEAEDLIEDEEEDMAKIQELQAELSRERKAREAAEQQSQQVQQEQKKLHQELDNLQKIKADKNSNEQQIQERVKKLETALRESRNQNKELEDLRKKQVGFEREVQEVKQQKLQVEKDYAELMLQMKSQMGVEPETPAADIFAEDEAPLSDEGRFENLPYSVLLGRLRKHNFSGVLAISAGSVTREIFIVNGLPVAFASSSPGERLGRILVEQKQITEEQYLKATSRMVERGVSLTDALLELDYIDQEQLTEQQRVLTRDRIVSGFALNEGRFSLSHDVKPAKESAEFEFSLGEIYSTGYRQYASEGEVTALYESLRGLYLKTGAELDAHRSQLGLEAQDERLLHLFGQAYSLEEAVAEADISEERAARLLGALKGLGLIRAWNPGAKEFESRVHQMQLQHQTALLSLREELQAREDRLVDTFEQALAKIEAGPGSSQASALGREAEKKSNTVKTQKIISVHDKEKSSDSGPFARLGSPSKARSGKPVKPAAHAKSEARTEPGFDASTLQKNLSTSDVSRVSTAKAKVEAKDKSSVSPAKSSVIVSEEAKDSLVNKEPGTDRVKVAEKSDKKDKTEKAISGLTLTSGTPVIDEKMSPAEQKFREGMNKAAQGQLDQAELALRESVRLDPQKSSYLAALARVLLSNPKYDRGGTLPVVRSLLDRAQVLSPDDEEVRALLARVSSEQTQLET